MFLLLIQLKIILCGDLCYFWSLNTLYNNYGYFNKIQKPEFNLKQKCNVFV